MAPFVFLPGLPFGGPDAEAWISLLWHGGLGLLCLGVAWAAMLGLDFLALPWLPGGLWKRPWCWLFGHIEGEDFEITEAGFFDRCTRCHRLEPSDED